MHLFGSHRGNHGGFIPTGSGDPSSTRPNAGFSGTDRLHLPHHETAGGLEDTATVTITVVADPYPASRTVCEGEPLPGTFTLGPGGLFEPLDMHLPV